MENFRNLLRSIEEDKFSFPKDRYPPLERFRKIQKPIAISPHVQMKNVWAQIPFCGSLVYPLYPVTMSDCEKFYFQVSEIQDIIDFIKDTGKLQLTLPSSPLLYAGLDYLDPFFECLRPPTNPAAVTITLGSEAQLKQTEDSFYTLGKVKYLNFLKLKCTISPHEQNQLLPIINHNLGTYVALKVGGYSLAEEIENQMIDDPAKALRLFEICEKFIVDPLNEILGDTIGFVFEDALTSRTLPPSYQPEQMPFPCEIGRFLTKKLTFAAQDMRACYDILDHYHAYDLSKVQESLNEAIVTNHLETVASNAEELSKILDNIWQDQTIPNRIKNIEVGIPILIAALGGVFGGVSGLFAGGFLSTLGLKVAEKAAEKFYSEKALNVTERMAKWRTKSYQANVYDFKKKYNK